MSREIKDVRDPVSGELVYIKNHAKATYMSSGVTVEDAINNIGNTIDLSDKVSSDNKTITNIICITQDEYDGLDSKISDTTLYIIIN